MCAKAWRQEIPSEDDKAKLKQWRRECDGVGTRNAKDPQLLTQCETEEKGEKGSRMKMGKRDRKAGEWAFLLHFNDLFCSLSLPSIVIFYKHVFILVFVI